MSVNKLFRKASNVKENLSLQPVHHAFEDNVITYLFPHFIPLDEVLWDNRTVITKNYSVCQLIRLSGVDAQGLSREELDALHKVRSTFFANADLGGKVQLCFHSRRRKERFAKSAYSFEDALAHEVAEEHLAQFEDGYITEITIVVTMPLDNLTINKTGLPSEGLSQENKLLAKYLRELDFVTDKVTTLLQDFDPYVVTHSHEGESDLLQFWMELCNGGKSVVTAHRNDRLDQHTSFSDVEFFPKQKYLTFTDNTTNRARYATFLGLSAYPPESLEGILDSVMALQHDLNVIQYFMPQHVEDTKGKIDKSIKMLSSVQGFTQGRFSDLAQAAGFVADGKVNFHGHVVAICVYGDSELELEQGVNQVQKAVSPLGIVLIREGWNLHGGFFGQFPDGERFLEGRKVLLTPDNLAQFISLSGAHEGHRHCAFGNDSVVPFKRPDGTIYHFNWHPTPAPDVSPHTFLCGAPGSGKTMLAMFLIMMSMKFKGLSGDRPLKTLLFDSGKGAKIPTLAFGGSYHTLKEEADISLNPMSMEETVANKDFLLRFIKMLAGNDITPRQEQTITELIRQNYQLKPQKRRLYELRDLLGQHGAVEDGKASLATLLDKWLPDEEDPSHSDAPNGLIFNAQHDTLNFDKQLVGFDMSMALKDPDLLAPLTSYIFHRFNQMIANNPSPHLIFVDEVAQYLEHPIFGDYILKILREQRKKGGAMIMAAQEPTVLTGTENGRAALDNIETFLIWPNTSARPEHYMENGLGLNDREFAWVKNPKGKREVMVKRKNGGSVILDIDLSHLGKHFNLFQSRATLVELAEKLMKEMPEDWINQYMEIANG
jgi:type IV secretion/conjugal transfer VirB4 family ATPase